MGTQKGKRWRQDDGITASLGCHKHCLAHPGRPTLRLVAQAAGAVPSTVTSRGMECLVKATSAGHQGLNGGREGWPLVCVTDW